MVLNDGKEVVSLLVDGCGGIDVTYTKFSIGNALRQK